MSCKQGFTLMEMLIVLAIIGVCIALFLPNYLKPTEQSRALVAKNNLLAIYTAQQNYRNNNGTFYVTPGSPSNDLSGINTALSLNFTDDGSYNYLCNTSASGFSCQATRVLSPGITLLVTNSPIGSANPSCLDSHTTGWCP